MKQVSGSHTSKKVTRLYDKPKAVPLKKVHTLGFTNNNINRDRNAFRSAFGMSRSFSYGLSEQKKKLFPTNTSVKGVNYHSFSRSNHQLHHHSLSHHMDIMNQKRNNFHHKILFLKNFENNTLTQTSQGSVMKGAFRKISTSAIPLSPRQIGPDPDQFFRNEEKRLRDLQGVHTPTHDDMVGIPSVQDHPNLEKFWYKPDSLLPDLISLEKESKELIYHPDSSLEERLEAKKNFEEIVAMKEETKQQENDVEQRGKARMWHFNREEMNLVDEIDPDQHPKNENFHGYVTKKQWTGKYEDLDKDQLYSRPFYPLVDPENTLPYPKNVRPGINIGNFNLDHSPIEIPTSWKRVGEIAHQVVPPILLWPLKNNPLTWWYKIINRGYIYFAPKGRRKLNYWRSYASKYNKARMLEVEEGKAMAPYYRDSYMFYWIMHIKSRLRGFKDRTKNHFLIPTQTTPTCDEGPPMGLEPGRSLWLGGMRPRRIRFVLLVIVILLLVTFVWGPMWNRAQREHQNSRMEGRLRRV